MSSISVHLIYFSPTGTTRTIVDRVAAELAAADIKTYDLTLLAEAPELRITDGVTIIGVPVYAGRVPEVCLQRMEQITAEGVPAILIALYGNREFEDALVELQDIAEAKGFKVIAAAAFIGEHSYSTPSKPIAAGRPDDNDFWKAAAFGQKIAGLLDKELVSERLAIPGDRPYKARPPRGPIAPTADPAHCTLCAACAKICPTAAIRVTGTLMETNADACILCCACVKICPEHARHLDHPMVQERRRMLVANCSHRKEPAIFMATS